MPVPLRLATVIGSPLYPVRGTLPNSTGSVAVVPVGTTCCKRTSTSPAKGISRELSNEYVTFAVDTAIPVELIQGMPALFTIALSSLD